MDKLTSPVGAAFLGALAIAVGAAGAHLTATVSLWFGVIPAVVCVAGIALCAWSVRELPEPPQVDETPDVAPDVFCRPARVQPSCHQFWRFTCMQAVLTRGGEPR